MARRSRLAIAWAIAVTLVGARALADEEVRVRGDRREPSATTFSANDVREMPGAFGDPARAIEALPGVIPLGSGLPFYFVRGATPANAAYFVDGIRVPLFSHGPPGGGIVAQSLVESVDFHPAAPPARFGGVTGPVLAVKTTAPADRLHGSARTTFYDTSALVEAPFDDGRASLLASGRVGYTQLLLNLLDPTAHQQYWDYYARGTSQIFGTRDRLTITALGAYDAVSGSIIDASVDTAFHRVDVRWDTSIASRSQLTIAATIGENRQSNDTGSVGDRILAFRAEATTPLTETVKLGSGVSMMLERYVVDVTSPVGTPDPQVLFAPRKDLALSAWSDVLVRPSPSVDVDLGVRLGMFATKRDEYPQGEYAGITRSHGIVPPPGAVAKPTVDPRVVTRVRLARGVTFVGTSAVTRSPPAFLLPGVAMSRLEDGLQTAVQSSAGIETALPGSIGARVTAFLHDYLNLSDPTATCPTSTSLLFDPTAACFARRVRGRTFGAEVLLRRPLTERLAGFVSYTLSRSTRETHAPGWAILGASQEQLVTVLSEWDRTHSLSAMVAYDLGRSWRAGARFSLASGRPYSHTVSGVFVGPYSSDRLPAVHRLDLRLEKTWSFGPDRRVSLLFEGFNVTTFQEPTECRPRPPLALDPVPGGLVRGAPIDACVTRRAPALTIPSIGVEGTF